jgi:microcystin degradation protein MlrC
VKDAVVPGITAPQIVSKCRSADVGAFVKLSLGGEHSLFKNRRMIATALVEEAGDSFKQFGPYPVDEGPWVRVRINDIIVTFHERRIGIVAKAHFHALGIDPEKHRIYVLKQGYLFPEFESIARKYILLFSPGATEYDLSHFKFTKLQRPVYPLDTDMTWEARDQSIKK